MFAPDEMIVFLMVSKLMRKPETLIFFQNNIYCILQTLDVASPGQSRIDLVLLITFK